VRGQLASGLHNAQQRTASPAADSVKNDSSKLSKSGRVGNGVPRTLTVPTPPPCSGLKFFGLIQPKRPQARGVLPIGWLVLSAK